MNRLLPAPSTGATLYAAPLDLTCHPAAVKVARLRLHALSIYKAIPRSCIETQIASNGSEAGSWLIVRPDAVLNDFTWLGWIRDIVVSRGALPLAHSGAAVLLKWRFQ